MHLNARGAERAIRYAKRALPPRRVSNTRHLQRLCPALLCFERRVLKRAVIAYERGVVCLCLHVKSAVCEKSAEK